MLLLLSTKTLFSQFPGSGNTIDFQTNREIRGPVGAALQPSATFSDLTVEAWIFWRGQSGGNSGILEGRSSAIHFEITDNNDPGRLRVRVNSNDALIINGAVPKNQWVHLAFVYDNTPGSEQIRAYRNGVLIGSRNGASGAGANFNTWLRIGISCCTGGTERPFNGQIDEFRIWYKAKTEAEIREQMCQKLVLPQANLTLYYRMDQIIGTTIPDLSGNGNDGTVVNIVPATHLVVSEAPIGDQSINIYPGSWVGQQLDLSGSANDMFRVSNVLGNPNGVHIYSVDELPNTTTGVLGLGGNDAYYGVFAANGTTPTYTWTYFYGSNTSFLNSEPTIDENDLAVFTRFNNAIMSWANTGAPVNIPMKFISSTSANAEFILGLLGGDQLPVELLYLTATAKESNVEIDWATASELNSSHYTVERSIDGLNWEFVGKVNAGGNSNQLIAYTLKDEKPHRGLSYYRLEQVDMDNTKKTYGPVAVELRKSGVITFYPNPVENIVYVESSENTLLTIYDNMGRLIKEQHIEKGINQLNLSEMPSGLYLLQTSGRLELTKLSKK
ncbi:MAG: LamG-like jellyroll fold domain-containing protein [Flavobacteriales bacterium]